MSLRRSAVIGGAIGVLFAAAAVALGGSGAGSVFNLGADNTVNKTTTLNNTSSFTGPQLQVENTAGGVALDLQVASGKPPLSVNSAARVLNLDADLLGGHHAGYFLSSTGKAANASKLDNEPPSEFMNGGGTVFHFNLNVDADGGTHQVFADSGGGPAFDVGYTCPTTTTNPGAVTFDNNDSSDADVFVDNGGSDPLYDTVPAGTSLPSGSTNAAGDFYTLDAFWPDGRHATIWMTSVHHRNIPFGSFWCHVQGQVIVGT